MPYIFDFFGVISSELADPWFREYIPTHNVSDLREKYVHYADLGTLPLSSYFGVLADLSHQKIEVVEKQWRDRVIINQEVISVIRRLKDGNKIALCSNAPAALLRPILKDNNLESLFDVIVISGEIGMIKPNHDIFNHTLNLLKTEAPEATFIDDNETNIESAKALGMNVIHFKSISDLSGLN